MGRGTVSEVGRCCRGARKQQELELDDAWTARYVERIAAVETLLTILPENKRAKQRRQRTGSNMLGMRTLVLTAVFTMIAAVPFGPMFGQTEPNQRAAEIPSDLLATLQNDLKEDELDEAKSCLEREGLSWSEIVRVTRFDLNRPRQAWLVEGLGPCLAGNANGLKLLYIRADNGWRKILDDSGQSLEVCAQAVPPCPVSSGSERRSTSTHGWPDLALWRHGSASEGDQLVYRFDGNVYKKIACSHRSPGGNHHSEPRYSPCLRGWKASE